MELRYKYRIYPNTEQKITLSKVFGCSRVVYNTALALRKELYTKDKTKISDTELQKQIITNSDKEWIKEVSQIPLVQTIRDLGLGFRRFLKIGKGYPNFKKKSSIQSIRFTRNGFKLKNNNKLFIAKTGDIKLKLSRAKELVSLSSSVTIIKDGINKYYASFVVKIDDNIKLSTLPKSKKEIGIDLGTTRLLTTSDGEIIDNPKFLKRLEKKLIKAQKSLSNKKKGSNNRNKAIFRLNKIYNKIKNSRSDYLHKLSIRILSENQVVYVENIDTKQLLQAKLKFYRNRISKSIADSGWSIFLNMLEYKAKIYGKIFKRVPAEYTSQICNRCKYHIGKLTLDIREWVCNKCGILQDRDINAAMNIKTVGQTGIVCGVYVRPDSLGGDVEAETSENMQVIITPELG